MIESDLYHYFASIGINEQQQRQAVTGVFDTADIDTIQKLCQKEKMHLRYESIGKNESKEITKLTYEQLCNSLKKRHISSRIFHLSTRKRLEKSFYGRPRI